MTRADGRFNLQEILDMKPFFGLILFLASQHSFGQTTTITGTVKNEKNRPIRGAAISIQTSYDGATSDSLGNFRFETMETGKQVFLVTAPGFKEFSDTVVLTGGALLRDIQLKAKEQNLDAVVITVGTFAAGDQSRAAELSALDILTTAGADADITSAIKTLPGAQQVGESDGLFVRGGTADESKVYIDGTLVNNFYFSKQPGQASRGRFNPVLFKGTVFSSGGYSALYGQALSSVLLLESIDLPERTSGAVGISFLGANAGVQKLSKNEKNSWGINAGYTNLGLAYQVVKQKADYVKAPEVREIDANFRIKTAGGGMLKYYGYFNWSRLAFRYADIDSAGIKNHFSLRNANIYQNVSWRENLGKGWKVRIGASYSNNADRFKNRLEDENDAKLPPLNSPVLQQKALDMQSTGNYVNGRWTLEKNPTLFNSVRFGIEYQYSDETFKNGEEDGSVATLKTGERLWAPYAEGDITLFSKLALRAGFRTEHSKQMNKWNSAPRLSLAYRFADKGQVSFAYGQFYQSISNKYRRLSDDFQFEKAEHYILQYQKMHNQRVFRTEVFYKKYGDLVKTIGTENSFTAVNNKGFGDAKGLEIFWRDKKTFQYFDYRFSYSYLDTKRDFLNYPRALQPPFASKHTASLVANYLVLSWKLQVNAGYAYAAGRPYYDLQHSGGEYRIRREGVAKDFHDLSLSFNYLPQLGKRNAKSFSVLVLSINNVPGFKNVYSYQFSADGSTKQAVLPPARRFFFIGYFISFGIDRTKEAMDNAL